MEEALAALLWLLFWIIGGIAGLAVLLFVAVLIVGAVTGIREGVAASRQKRASRR